MLPFTTVLVSIQKGSVMWRRSLSYKEQLLGQSGAGVAEKGEHGRDTGAGAELYTKLNLILVVFL